MLGHGNDDFVAFVQEIHAVAVRDKVQALRRVLGEHNFVVLGIKELRHVMAGTLVGVGGTHGQLRGGGLRSLYYNS